MELNEFKKVWKSIQYQLVLLGDFSVTLLHVSSRVRSKNTRASCFQAFKWVTRCISLPAKYTTGQVAS